MNKPVLGHYIRVVASLKGLTFAVSVANRLPVLLRGVLVICLTLGLSCAVSYGQQDATRQLADRYFYSQAYASAVASYIELLKDNSLPDEARQDILFNLGYAYKQLGDYAKSENVFRQLLELGEPTGKYQPAYLYYAQVLANNGDYQQAQDMYARYEEIKSSLPLPPSDLKGEIKNGIGKATYRVERLGINTDESEFSPAYFREGLVYIAGKGAASGIGSSDKGYLDLYYVPNRSALASTGTVDASGKLVPLSTPRVANDATGTYLGRDFYTAATANDSPLAANYAPIEFSEGLGMRRKSNGEASSGTSPELFSKELTTKYHEGPLTFSSDGNTIIFTRNNYNNGKSRSSSDNVNKLKLYTAQLRDGGWVNVKELPFNSNNYSSGHPALSRDGKLLYFVSDRPGGRGGTDIYVSRMENGTWSQPLNLGPEINSGGDEMFPFVDENGNLYFASNGRADRLGGLDIYYAALAGGGTPVITPLEAPINSKGDDFGLITDAKRSMGYFSSNRLKTNDDIFRFVRESALYGCRTLALKVVEEGSSSPLDSVTVSVKARGEGRDEKFLLTNAEGRVEVCLEADNDFMFELSKDGYVSGLMGFSTVGLTDEQPTYLGASLNKLDMPATKVERGRAPGRVTSGSDNARSPGTSDDKWENDAAISVPTLRGTVLCEPDNKPLEGVRVILRNECNEKIKQTVTGPDGRFSFDIVEGCDYTLVASKPAYGTNTNTIRKIPKAPKPKVVSTNLIMMKVGDLVTLDKIYYESGKWNITKDVARELDKMVATMIKYPSMKIEIGSHTDSQGDAQLNQYLSERRAKAALNYLASKGIARGRMTAVGYGETQLLNQCKDGVLCTEAEHEQNRRTEFKVLSIR